MHEAGGGAVLDLIQANLRPCLAGSAAAVSAFRESDVAGSIVNVSSHQATRPARGALPYAKAKAAIEGLTKAMAVDYGPWKVRFNAVSLGSIVTERLEHYRASQSEEDQERVDRHMEELHPLGRAGVASEVSEVVEFLLSEQSSFLNGAVNPVDGGLSVQGPDPEAQGTPPQ